MGVVQTGIQIRELTDIEDLQRLEQVFMDIWRREGATPISAELMRALAHAGNYVTGAYQEDRLVGGLVGFFGQLPGGALHLHSHILGVLPEQQLRGTGFALKQHQRSWALERDIVEVTWTFDPLVRRNGYFNVCKLGADVLEYHVDFYGAMGDGINGQGASDRVLAVWRLDSERAVQAAAGRPEEPQLEALLDAGAKVALSEGPDGGPQVDAVGGAVMLCQTPADVVDLRVADGSSADGWRRALRDTMGAALHDGYATVGMTRSGWYVLRRQGG
ncbi:MAG TPA: GNAT family N-acetyltransferase [Candidatus Dormibacteraeota bacterium]